MEYTPRLTRLRRARLGEIDDGPGYSIHDGGLASAWEKLGSLFFGQPKLGREPPDQVSSSDFSTIRSAKRRKHQRLKIRDRHGAE
jgi:hypothetical protein